MSELINNRQERQKILKELILELHDGKSVEEVKDRFAHVIDGISVTEITAMESQLVKEGLAIEEIQRLCDVHAAVFKGSIEEIHRADQVEDTPGHPIFNFKLENRAIENLINNSILPELNKYMEGLTSNDFLLEKFSKLLEIDKHYSRKENLLFPYLEKYSITAPPKVMWGVDDEIRNSIKETIKLIKSNDKEKISTMVTKTAKDITEMIFKEENILFPMAVETLTIDEWQEIAIHEDEIGYTIVSPRTKWLAEKENQKSTDKEDDTIYNDLIDFDAGSLSQTEINAILNTIPVDITFVDKDGYVKYFTQGKERIFARPKTVLKREVSNCHPPASVHIVEGIVEDLKSGKKDVEDFWIKMQDKYILIRYFAVRDKDGNYLGTMEFSQDIGPIKAIEGEKRLADGI